MYVCVCRIFLQKSGRAPDLTPGQNFLFWVLSCSPGKYLGGGGGVFFIFLKFSFLGPWERSKVGPGPKKIEKKVFLKSF